MLANRFAIIVAAATLASAAAAEETPAVQPECIDQKKAGDLAHSLANPIGTLLAIPLDGNTQLGVGSDNHVRYIMSATAGIPIIINKDWHIATKTSLNVVEEAAPRGTSPINLGDTNVTAYLVPPNIGPFIWGIGATGLFPTATSINTGANHWGAGPAGAALIQIDALTLGILASQTFGFIPIRGQQAFETTVLDPFISVGTDSGFSVAAQSNTSIRWTLQATAVSLPLELALSQVAVEGPVPMSFQVAVAYLVVHPVEDAKWNIRASVILAFPGL